MDIQSIAEVQKLLDKLIARNKFTATEAKSFRTLLENTRARDDCNFQTIMEKIKDYGANILVEANISPIDSRFDDGE